MLPPQIENLIDGMLSEKNPEHIRRNHYTTLFRIYTEVEKAINTFEKREQVKPHREKPRRMVKATI